MSSALDAETRNALDALLKKDDALSGLAVLKQEAKDFRWRQMACEREKRGQLSPLYQVARQLLPGLGVSQQNLLYFANLVNFYTIHDLRNLKKEQTWLYMMCYIWLRYRQLSDNFTIVDTRNLTSFRRFANNQYLVTGARETERALSTALQ